MRHSRSWLVWGSSRGLPEQAQPRTEDAWPPPAVAATAPSSSSWPEDHGTAWKVGTWKVGTWKVGTWKVGTRVYAYLRETPPPPPLDRCARPDRVSGSWRGDGQRGNVGLRTVFGPVDLGKTERKPPARRHLSTNLSQHSGVKGEGPRAKGPVRRSDGPATGASPRGTTGTPQVMVPMVQGVVLRVPRSVHSAEAGRPAPVPTGGHPQARTVCELQSPANRTPPSLPASGAWGGGGGGMRQATAGPAKGPIDPKTRRDSCREAAVALTPFP